MTNTNEKRLDRRVELVVPLLHSGFCNKLNLNPTNTFLPRNMKLLTSSLLICSASAFLTTPVSLLPTLSKSRI